MSHPAAPSGTDPEGPEGPASHASPAGIDQDARTPAQRRRTFHHILANTALAGLTTSYLWFALSFWIYLETRNVVATGVIGGSYMLVLALTSLSFGTLVDRFRKLAVMRLAAAVTFVAFAAAALVFAAAPEGAIADVSRPWLWVFSLTVLFGAVVENLRMIALSTTVTILVDPEERANANGLVGMVQGLMFLVTSVLSGVSVGQLGMGWTLAVALVLVGLTAVHLLALHMPEETRPVHSDAHGAFDVRGAWRAVRAVPGLVALILFSTFNNLIGGTYMALMDPYGLELFNVETWGIVFAVSATGFLVGGAAVGRWGLGANPLRTMLLAVAGMGVLGAFFTIREWPLLYAGGIWLYMCLVPLVEAAEQTVVQRVVPLSSQGRVFGLATAFEASAAPVTAFLVAPLAQYWVIPFARSPEGARALEPVLGTGTGSGRGIALVFLVSGLLMAAAALVALASPVYRRISREYAAARTADLAEGAGTPGTGRADGTDAIALPNDEASGPPA